ncbi:DUF4249 domain-containing protein [Saprospiraceae bacterium]|nr:DUF4249 domain-containing protein [Saprospiraceae bacterium]
MSGQYQEKLVLNGIAEIDRPISVQLSKTKNRLNKEDKIDWIRNAEVYLTCGQNNFQEKLTYDSLGIYTSSHVAKYAESYSLEIVHAKYLGVTAEGIMPGEPEAIVKYLNESEEGRSSVFSLEIKQRKKDHFYIWEMEVDESDVGEATAVSIVSTDDKTDKVIPDYSIEQSKIFLEGYAVEGDDISSTFIAEDIDENTAVKATVRLFTMNKDMYNYYRSLELYNNSQASLAQPIEIYSNIENGLGIFGAISETVITIER